MPVNSQISIDSPPWDGKVTEEPDEDDREELNLGEVNRSVIADLAKKNQNLLEDIEKCSSSILLKMASKMRQILSFMQKPVRVYTAEEVETEDKWQEFLNKESLKISSPFLQYKHLITLAIAYVNVSIGGQL